MRRFDPSNAPGGALGILRHGTTGDPYVAQSDAPWRLDSRLLVPPTDAPALSLPGAVVIAGFPLAAGVFRLQRASAATAAPFLPTPRSFRPDRSPPG